MAKKILTNTEFAVKNEFFGKCVDAAADAGHKVSHTARQASKFRNKKGVAYKHSKGLIK